MPRGRGTLARWWTSAGVRGLVDWWTVGLEDSWTLDTLKAWGIACPSTMSGPNPGCHSRLRWMAVGYYYYYDSALLSGPWSRTEGGGEASLSRSLLLHLDRSLLCLCPSGSRSSVSALACGDNDEFSSHSHAHEHYLQCEEESGNCLGEASHTVRLTDALLICPHGLGLGDFGALTTPGGFPPTSLACLPKSELRTHDTTRHYWSGTDYLWSAIN